ncbi:MAG: hypothetical protein AB8H80_04795 [Planctomycetota bacterium]
MRPGSHRALRFLPPAGALTVAMLASCCGGRSSVHRSGLPFAELFVDVRELVRTADIERTRLVLAEAELPATDAHHQRLREVLDEQVSISAGHLQLLVEAVHLPETIYYSSEDGSGAVDVRRFANLESGEFAPVADALLLAGSAKLMALDAAKLGELLARSHADATRAELMACHFDKVVVDGPPGRREAALVELLHGMRGSPARRALLLRELVPNGHLDGGPGFALVCSLSFDDERVELLQALAARQPKIEEVDLLRVLESMSFDAGRSQCLAVMAPRVRELSVAGARRAVGQFAFDQGRCEAVKALVASGSLRVDHRELAAFAKLCSFDLGRVEVACLLHPVLHGEPNEATAQSLLQLPSFDQGRMQMVELMANSWRSLAPSARDRLVQRMSFERGRTFAAECLQ